MSLGYRIKQVRQSAGLNMQSFGERLGISSPSVSRLESCINNPSEQTIRAICSEFHVNRDWLVDGIGDMKASPALIPELLTRLHKYPRVAEFLASMTPEEWRVFNGMLDRVFEHQNKKDGI